MGLDFTLLSRAISDNEGDHLFITSDEYGWKIELWNKQADDLVGTYCIANTINLRTILSFIPENNLSFVTNNIEAEKILKEMGLCQ